jgi:HEAT repeat protein
MNNTRKRIATILFSAVVCLGTVGSAHADRRNVQTAEANGEPAEDRDRAARIGQLADTLSTSSADKERISAAVALGRLNDKRALRPLVNALKDSNHVVRAIAAASLGRLGHQAALPALQVACEDSDEMVRKRALEAISAIRAGGSSTPGAPTTANALTVAPPPRAGFGDSPRVATARPELFVVIKSTIDDSSGKRTDKQRKESAATVRALVARELTSTSAVTSDAKIAGRYGIDRHNIDVSITKLGAVPNGAFMDIECELRVAISNDRGKMLSFVSGGAKVQIPKRSFNEKYLQNFANEAMENAVKGLYQNLIKHLRLVNPS